MSTFIQIPVDRAVVTVDFEELAGWAEESSPLYAAICEIVVDDAALQSLAAHVPEGRATANVFLAAVQYLLLRGADHPLAEYYPSVVDDARAPDDDLADALRDFCRTYEAELIPILETRHTQTNAVRRCVALYPAFCAVAEEVDGPIALVELGPSAGLNLLFDRYRYEFEGTAVGATGPRIVGADESPVTITTDVRGESAPPLADDPPAVHSRVGIDLNPMVVTDEEDAAWLQALVWPEQTDRRRVLEGAIEMAQDDPPRLVEGDMIETLPMVLDEVPAEIPVVVYSTLVLYQVPEAVREELTELLETRMTDRPIHWLSGDGIYGDSDGITLEWTRLVDGEPATELLGAFEQHGEWVAWDVDQS